MEHVLVGTLACAFVLKIGAFVHVDQVEARATDTYQCQLNGMESEGKV